MSNEQDTKDFSGLAALSICKSLLLALIDCRVLSDDEIRGILEDAAAAHRNAIGTPQEREVHVAVAAIIDRMQAGRHLMPN